MQKSISALICATLLLCSACQKETKIKIEQDGAVVAVTIPQDATAAELINMQTALNNTLTIKAERERMEFKLAEAKQHKSERQFYAVLVVGGVVSGIVSVFAVAMVFFAWKFRRSS